MSDEKRNKLPKFLREVDLKTEFLESFAGGAGKAAGMGTVIIIALVLVKLLGIDMGSLTQGL